MSTKLCVSFAVCLVGVSLAVVGSPQAAASSLTAGQQAAVDTAVQSEMNKQKVVGVAVGVLREGKVAYLKGYGLADRERNLPVTTRTVFNWASNSKPILALLIMLLFGQGQFDLDDDVRKFVPEYPEQKKEVIKIRHLLSHMSGIPHYGKGVVARKKAQLDPLAELDPVVSLARLSLSPLQFRPGEKVLYSSYGYVLLSAVAQRAGKQPLFDQVKAKIVKPLGITSFQMDVPFKDQPDWAVGYVQGANNAQKVAGVPEFWKHGAGAYKSNIEDFAKWAEALLTRKLHSKKLEDATWLPQNTNDGTQTTRGLGFLVERQNGRLKISHNGSQQVTATRLVLYSEDGHGVVVMSNCQYCNPGQFSTAVYGALSGK